MYPKYIFIFFCAFFVIFIIGVDPGCSKIEEPIPEENINFGMYLLKDTIVKIYDANYIELKDYPIQDQPLLTNKNIEYYDWSSHFIYLKTRPKVFNEMTGMNTNGLWLGRPFVFATDSGICYMGYFGPSSDIAYIKIFPNIDPGLFYTNPIDVIEIRYGDNHIQKDIRQDDRIRKSLIKSGLLHEGLSVTLDSLGIFKADTSTIEYFITIENKDKDVLFAYDPDKAGSDEFNHYNKGITFLNVENNTEYYAKYKKYTSSHYEGEVNMNFYTKLIPDSSIKRKITVKGYENIPFGKYYCQYKYYAPTLAIEKEMRIVSGGIIWIGKTLTNIIDITFDVNNNCRINNKNVFLN